MSDKAAYLTSDQIDDLLLSARYGDLEDLESTLSPLLSSSSPSDLLASIKNDSANTLLHYASANGHLEIVTYLLPHITLPLALAQNESGNTPLHWAGLNGHLSVVRALVSHIESLERANPEEAKRMNVIFHPPTSSSTGEEKEDDGSERKLWDVRNRAGRGPMSEAQMREQEEVVKFLLERMIDGPEGSTLQPAEPMPEKPSTETTATDGVEQQTANLSLNGDDKP
ncbi:Ankyrin repeat-containing domain protein [Kalmanozyma brasiliensis GHG001]|uniref:Uncharacterized protein n=1 Tax=Kalmanozyma brasiliensis (strain GHG001) TaxID=1365824 RepID=V5GMD3_KALBG|nr:Ankyrin repeat-containing domain protein [Kalmanozyma brasiliensis GHG001]EST07122.1 Ankyrin repeat-containing domain protein [Kalmanozyma brasiliensis GHG001]